VVQADAPEVPEILLDLLCETDRLTNELQTVLRRIGVELGRLGISPSALPDSFRPPATPAVDSLSARESEIALLLMEGDRVSSVARALFISRHTVRNHLQSIYRKLRVSSQAELIEKLKGSARTGRVPGKLPRRG
jgi:DNA-binding CsgD family transcriptional regulator